MKNCIKILLTLLVLSLALTGLTSCDKSGECGEDLTWTLDGGGTLTISGKGAIKDCSFQASPWFLERDKIKSIVIEEGVTEIGGKAFLRCENAVRVTLPDSLTRIGDGAFYYCESLKEIVLPDGVTYIGESAFYQCTSLEEISIPEEVRELGNYVFSECTSLESISLPRGLTKIPESAFSHTVIRSMDLPDTVTEIGQFAFNGCTALERVAVPRSVTRMGIAVFYGCTSLVSIDVSTDNGHYASEDGVLYNKDKTEFICMPAGKKLTSYSVPEGVKTVGGYAFCDCTHMESVIIPYTVEHIADDAFRGWTESQHIYVKADIKGWDIAWENWHTAQIHFEG